jgi:multiple sugar transport system substrate-binding protein/raffinose/stachyose/melibiose transport system substrate-binding protein
MMRLAIIKIGRTCQASKDRMDFTTLYRRYVNRVYRYVLIRVANPRIAQELAAQTFLVALERFVDYRGNQFDLEVWLLDIARYRVIDHLRYSPPESNGQVLFSTSSSEQEINGQLQLEQVARVLLALPSEQAVALTLRVFGELSAAQVGQLISESEVSVKRSIYQAIRGFEKLPPSVNEDQAASELDKILTTQQARMKLPLPTTLYPEEIALVDRLVALVKTIRPAPAFTTRLETRLNRAQGSEKSSSNLALEELKGVELLWESSVPGHQFLVWLYWPFRVVGDRWWYRFNSRRNWSRQGSSRLALTMTLVGLVLAITGSTWFISKGRLQTSPPLTVKSQAATSAPASTPAQIQLIFDSTIFCPADPIDKKAIIRFAKLHPNIEVGRRCLGPFFYKIAQDLASPAPPHLSSLFAGSNVRSLANQGLLLDISDLWRQGGWHEAYPDWLRELSTFDGQSQLVFVNPSEPPLQLQILGAGEGGQYTIPEQHSLPKQHLLPEQHFLPKQYFLPTAYTWWAIYYNKSILDRYNLKPPKTWNEFLVVSEKLKQNGITPMAIPDERSWFDYLNIRLNGPEFHRDLLRGQERYDDPRVRSVFESWQTLMDKGYFHSRNEYGYSQSILLMHREEAAMALGNSFFIRKAIPNKFQDNFDSFPFPSIDPAMPVGESTQTFGYIIPANASERETARAFLAHLGSLEAQSHLAEIPGLVPVHTDVDPSLLLPEARQGQILVQEADYVLSSFDSDSPKMMDRIGSRAFRRFLRKPTDLDHILILLEKTRREVFAGQG